MSEIVKIATQDSFLTPEKERMIRDVICRDASPDEIDVFMMVCRHVRLDPIMKQIYFVPRYDGNLKKMVYTAQTSIDGFRLIADRTGKYAPGPKTTYDYDANGNLISATSYIKKQTKDGTWHVVEGTAFYSEYVQKTKDGRVTKFWEEKPHLMLAKCGESLAFRKAFPNEFSNLHTEDEMSKDSIDVTPNEDKALSQEQLNELYSLSVQLPDLTEKIMKKHNIGSFRQLEPAKFEAVKDFLEIALRKRKEKEEAEKSTELQKAMDGE